jgi:hypothetical protein
VKVSGRPISYVNGSGRDYISRDRRKIMRTLAMLALSAEIRDKPITLPVVMWLRRPQIPPEKIDERQDAICKFAHL